MKFLLSLLVALLLIGGGSSNVEAQIGFRGTGTSTVRATDSRTTQTAAITAQTALATGTSPGAGLYKFNFYVNSSVVCATPGPAVAGITVTYTDETGTKTAQTVPLVVGGSGTLATTLALGTTTGAGYGVVVFWAAPSTNIQWATTYTGCTSGTGTYNVRVNLTQLQ
jgi:hypothetical protein